MLCLPALLLSSLHPQNLELEHYMHNTPPTGPPAAVAEGLLLLKAMVTAAAIDFTKFASTEEARRYMAPIIQPIDSWARSGTAAEASAGLRIQPSTDSAGDAPAVPAAAAQRSHSPC